MTLHLTGHRDGFAEGFTPITSLKETEDDTGIALGNWRLQNGQTVDKTIDLETAFLLMNGKVSIETSNNRAEFSRASLFDEGPSCVHVPAGESLRIHAQSALEFTVYSVANTKHFEPRLYQPRDVSNEPRGLGQVNNTCLRYVRTIFDDTNSDNNCDLVLGEVITFPGRWSSYPPHHHPQPEIYHYRFTSPHGFGHAELGEDVLKVRPNDTVKIFSPNCHAQVAAPGYGMYYSWVIRHLPGCRYTVPRFLEEHKWLMEEGAQCWMPKGMEEL